MRVTKKQREQLRKNWVKALRSGKYKQTKGVLCNARTGGHCCLGVACRVFDKMFPKTLEIKDIVARGKLATHFDGEYQYLPTKVINALGIETKSGQFHDPSAKYHWESSELTDWNDNGKSFKRIADLIESKPKGLFKPRT